MAIEKYEFLFIAKARIVKCWQQRTFTTTSDPDVLICVHECAGFGDQVYDVLIDKAWSCEGCRLKHINFHFFIYFVDVASEGRV